MKRLNTVNRVQSFILLKNKCESSRTAYSPTDVIGSRKKLVCVWNSSTLNTIIQKQEYWKGSHPSTVGIADQKNLQFEHPEYVSTNSRILYMAYYIKKNFDFTKENNLIRKISFFHALALHFIPMLSMENAQKNCTKSKSYYIPNIIEKSHTAESCFIFQQGFCICHQNIRITQQFFTRRKNNYITTWSVSHRQIGTTKV